VVVSCTLSKLHCVLDDLILDQMAVCPPKKIALPEMFQFVDVQPLNRKVYSGLDCLRFVEEVDREASADCAGLLDVYLELATINNWIKMVDIARVAIMYLKVSAQP